MEQPSSQKNQSTAVLLIGYKRIGFIENRLNELSKNSYIPIIASIDGSDEATEKLVTKSINEFVVRHPKMDIKFKIRQENLGLARHITLAISEVLDEYDQVIVVEDDIVLSQTFVNNMLKGFQLMKSNEEIGVVGGFSFFADNYFNLKRGKWRTSRYFPAWGWGIGRKHWSGYELVIPSDYLAILNQSQTWQSLSKYRKLMWTYRFKKVATDTPFTWDYQMQYMLFRQNLVTLLPTCRISDNEGFGSAASSNTKDERPRWMREERVFSGILQAKISKFSKVYEIVDAFTIAGDKRAAEIFVRFRKVFSTNMLERSR